MSGGKEFIWEGRGDGGRNARYTQFAGQAADDLRLTAIHFRLLAHLGRFNQNKGWVRLSQKELAERLGLCRPSVNKAIGELVSWDYIERRTQEESGESFCYYRVIIDNGECQGQLTPQLRGVSAAGDTGVRSSDTRVSPRKTQSRTSSIIIDSARKRARVGKSRFEKKRRKVRPMKISPSPDALKLGYDVATGWDREHLLSEFRGLNEDVELDNVDAAWIGFCQFRGPHPSAKPYKIQGSYDQRDRPGLRITNRDVQWHAWLDHLTNTGHGDLRVLAEKAGELTAAARWPTADVPLPLVSVKSEEVAA